MSATQPPQNSERVEFALSDPSQLRSLRDWARGQPGVDTQITPGRPGHGELGAVDVLTAIAGSGGIIALIKMLPEFLRARRSGLKITTTIRDQEFTIDASNVDDVMPILERLLRD